MNVLIVRTHEGKLLAATESEVASFDAYATIGWDYLDANGNWYAVRALIAFPVR